MRRTTFTCATDRAVLFREIVFQSASAFSCAPAPLRAPSCASASCWLARSWSRVSRAASNSSRLAPVRPPLDPCRRREGILRLGDRFDVPLVLFGFCRASLRRTFAARAAAGGAAVSHRATTAPSDRPANAPKPRWLQRVRQAGQADPDSSPALQCRQIACFVASVSRHPIAVMIVSAVFTPRRAHPRAPCPLRADPHACQTSRRRAPTATRPPPRRVRDTPAGPSNRPD